MAAETIAFFEGQYMPLKDARISVTGSGRAIVPVTRVNNRPLGNGGIDLLLNPAS